MRKKIPVKMSPHQIGLQEMLLISEMRDAPKPDLTFFGIVAGSLEPGDQLTPPLEAGLEKVAALVIEELKLLGVEITRKEAASI
jgi:hydrogenase maturation protease